jgi:uncharacterized protein DUF4386
MRKEMIGPLTGILFLVILIVGFIVAGEPPSADDGADEVTQFYLDNKDSVEFGAILIAVAGAALIFFTNYLRELFGAAGNRTLSATILVGGAIFGVGAAIDSTISIAIAEAADDIEPAQVQTLQALWDNDFVPIALGIFVFVVSFGISVLTTDVFPRWLGWVAIVIAVVGVTPIGFAAFPATGLLILVVCILLLARSRDTGPAAPPPAAPPTTP